MPYVIQDNTTYLRSNGERSCHVSYFMGCPTGFFNEFTSRIEEAKKYSTKRLAETNIKNRFHRSRDMVAVRIG